MTTCITKHVVGTSITVSFLQSTEERAFAEWYSSLRLH